MPCLLLQKKKIFSVLSGNGDIIDPDDNITAIGSGGSYAYAAGKALLEHTDMSADEIARKQ